MEGWGERCGRGRGVQIKTFINLFTPLLDSSPFHREYFSVFISCIVHILPLMTNALVFLYAQKQKTSRFPVDNLSSFLAIQLFHCQFVWHYSPTHVLYNSEIGLIDLEICRHFYKPVCLILSTAFV